MSYLSQVKSSREVRPRRTVLYGPHGVGKCFAKGTKVVMFNGTTKCVEDVAEGDRLMGPDSLPRTVSGVTVGRGQMYRINPTKGSGFVVNGDHILTVKSMGGLGIAKGEIANISVQDYLLLSANFQRRTGLYRSTCIYFQSQYVNVDPYVFGIWLAEGSAGSTSPAITTPDAEVLEAFNSYSQSLGVATCVAADRGQAKTYRASGKRPGFPESNGVLNALRATGAYKNKHIPQNYKSNSEQVRLELLAGFIDGDGYLSNGCYDLCLVNESLAHDIAFVSRSLGLAAYARPTEKQCVNNGSWGHYWRITISGDIDRIPCRVPRRIAKARAQVKNPLVTGFEIESIGIDDYFGFCVDSDHLFLLDDFTVVHNSTFGSKWPRPIFLPCEDGISDLDVPALPHAIDLQMAWEPVMELSMGGHEYKTLVIDTVDWLEKLVQKRICEKHGDKKCITDFDWGKGYGLVNDKFHEYLKCLNGCRDIGMHILLLAHSDAVKFKAPDSDSYDRYSPKLHKDVCETLMEWCDELLFVNYKTFTRTADEGSSSKGKGRTIGVGSGDRVMYTQDIPAHKAKNRLGLPREMPFDFDVYSQYLNNEEKENEDG